MGIWTEFHKTRIICQSLKFTFTRRYELPKIWLNQAKPYQWHLLVKKYLIAEAVEFLSTKDNYEIADRLAIIANLCNYEVRLDAQKLKELGYDLAVSVFCLALLNGDLSFARLPDGIEYKDLGVEQFSWDHITLNISNGQEVLHRTADMEIGPPSFSWAPRLVEGFTKRPRIRKDNKRYALEFLDSNAGLHIYGWLWRRYETLDFSDFAEIFEKRLSYNPEDTKNSSSPEEKWGMTTANQLDCF
ncbi:hypothetical protein B7494_g2426 [Chlorociboria aeruginascens]|nr:hypothetical protein B7494_g2426 [Chlorociboria aeruginascens]